MTALRHPVWIDKLNYSFQKYEDIPETVFEEVNRNLDHIQQGCPLVSIIISAWNEEVNILRCIASLAKLNALFSVEIIVVNNNSTDCTQATIDKLHVTALFEKTQGCGPARQLGQKNANGKYILLADADCFYPPCWAEEMLKVLRQPNVVCVYGRYSFIDEPGFPRWKLVIFEFMKDVIAEFRQLHRPYFNAYGISMGYVKVYGLKVGFITTNFWGDDGQLCLGLMDYGAVKPVRADCARAWTGPRTLQRNGNFNQALRMRVQKELKRFFNNFTSRLPKDARMRS